MLKKQINYKKIIVFWLLVFLLGGLAGILGNEVFLPWLGGVSPFSKIGWISRVKDGTTIINRTERVVISEDLAYLDAIEKQINSLVAVRSERHYRLVNKKQILLAKPEVLAEGSGFILTSDGYVVTTADVAPETATRFILTREGREIEAQLAKKDSVNGLALLKTGESNLPVVTLGDTENIKLGERIILMGMRGVSTTTKAFVREGFIRSVKPELSVDFSESQLANGGPLINLKGEVFGLAKIDKSGVIQIVATEIIKNFLKQ